MKYSLTNNTKEWCGITLHQIKAEMSFGNVSKGDLGGWIEKEANLNQNGNAWISGNAQIFGNAWIYGDAQIYGNARIYGDAQISGNAQIFGDAWIYGDLKISAGFFFGIRYKKENIKFVKLDDDYELIYKGEAKFGDNDKKQELLQKAQELIEKAEELKQQANQ